MLQNTKKWIKPCFTIVLMLMFLGCQRQSEPQDDLQNQLEELIIYLDLLSSELNHGIKSVDYLQTLQANLK